MYSVRKWIFKPKRSDTCLLARFFYADEALNIVAAELDSFDGRKEPERCSSWVARLRACQDKVLRVIEQIMMVTITEYHKASRDFRAKFPDDVLQDSLSGQLWFGAECLAAGSSILNREVESAYMRPLAKKMTRHLEYLRSLLRDQCLRNVTEYTSKIRKALIDFDRMFAEFELCYVSAMVSVKTVKEYDQMQDITVLFCNTTVRALRRGLVSQADLDYCDPALMFNIPRLAIITGLLVYPDGPLNPDLDPIEINEMFRPFQTLLFKIRQLLQTLDQEELKRLEFLLCDSEHSTTSGNTPLDMPQDKTGVNKCEQYSTLLTLTPPSPTINCSAVSSSQSLRRQRRTQSIGHAESWPTLSDQSTVTAGHHSIVNIADIGYIDASDDEDEEEEDQAMPSPHHTSEFLGDQISVAMDSAKQSKCSEARLKFHSTDDLIHRLFVCISGVADQLQTNSAGDLRSILKSVFIVSCTDDEDQDLITAQSVNAGICHAESIADGPSWVPDGNVSQCTGCHMNFNLMRRKHHCRNCGHIFCARCSDNYVTLPKLGSDKAQRVCTDCFVNAPNAPANAPAPSPVV